MPAVSTAGITELLNAWSNGDRSALEKLTPLVLPDLRQIAKRHLHRERTGQSLQTTALVNELYVRLIGVKGLDWKDRSHFLAFSATLIRHILVDAVRARRSRKRGGDVVKVSLDEAYGRPPQSQNDRVALFWGAKRPRNGRGSQRRAGYGKAGLEAGKGLLWHEMRKGHDA